MNETQDVAIQNEIQEFESQLRSDLNAMIRLVNRASEATYGKEQMSFGELCLMLNKIDLKNVYISSSFNYDLWSYGNRKGATEEQNAILFKFGSYPKFAYNQLAGEGKKMVDHETLLEISCGLSEVLAVLKEAKPLLKLGMKDGGTYVPFIDAYIKVYLPLLKIAVTIDKWIENAK